MIVVSPVLDVVVYPDEYRRVVIDITVRAGCATTLLPAVPRNEEHRNMGDLAGSRFHG